MRITRTTVENIVLRMAGREDSHDVAAETRLHAAVIAQAVVDCIDKSADNRVPARRDLFESGRMPPSVDLLGLDEEAVRELAQRFIEHSEARNAA